MPTLRASESARAPKLTPRRSADNGTQRHPASHPTSPEEVAEVLR